MTLEDGIRHRLGTFRPSPTVMNMNEMQVSPRGCPGKQRHARAQRSAHHPLGWVMSLLCPLPWEGAVLGGCCGSPCVWRQQLSTFPLTIPALPVLFFPLLLSTGFPSESQPHTAESAVGCSGALRVGCLWLQPNPAPVQGGQRVGAVGAGGEQAPCTPRAGALRFNCRGTSCAGIRQGRGRILPRSGKAGPESTAGGHNEGLRTSSAVQLLVYEIGHLVLVLHKQLLGLKSPSLGKVEGSSFPGTPKSRSYLAGSLGISILRGPAVGHRDADAGWGP